MGNCLQPVLMRSGSPYQQQHTSHEEETTPLVISTMHDQLVLNSTKKRKKVRFNVEPDNAAVVDTTTEPTTTMSSPRRIFKKGSAVRVKLVLTQSELKQILNRATLYHHLPPPPPLPLRLLSSVEQVSGRTMLQCRRSRRSSVKCTCRCSWIPALNTIPEECY